MASADRAYLRAPGAGAGRCRLYRLRWYLDDLASATRLFRNTHRDTADTRKWRNGLAHDLDQLHRWLDRLS
jgi:hypothetical protein